MHPSSLVSHVSRCTLINLLLARVHVVPCLLRPTRFLPSIVSLAGGGCLWIVGTVSHVLGRCSYSSRGTDLVSSVSVPLGGALKK